ncbi:MAG: NAD(P)/FAD-dependent oxidoreductase [Nanoarchaeota archaeon]|nr:NAD(P)/FAD-dependent oxidoreductase [Nanoarchaeota archaeon]
MYDVIIIGAGPAGLTAATNTAHRGLKTLVIEQYDETGGQPLIFYGDKIIKDHPGFPVGVPGKELSRLLDIQARNAGAEIHCSEEALSIKRIKQDDIIVKTTQGSYSGRRVILASGGLNIPAKLPMLKGCDNVYYKSRNIGRKFKDKTCIVIGGGDNAFDTALQIREVSSKVSIIVNHSYAKAKEVTVEEAAKKNIKVLYNTELKSVKKTKEEKLITHAVIHNTKTKKSKEMMVDAVFSAIGFSTVNEFLKNNGLLQNRDGSIKTDDKYETSVKGVYAAGDLCGEVKLIAVACARGIEAAINAFSSIKRPYWLS